MRLEANDKTGPLHCSQIPNQGGDQLQEGTGNTAEPPPLPVPAGECNSLAPECDDCGNHPISCRCTPGEG